jgi:hypothetical protein
LLESIQEAALQLIATVLAAATPIIVAYVLRLLKSSLTARQLDVARTIAEQSVRVAEELGAQTGAQGETKLAIAARTFSSLAGGVKNLKGLDQEKVYDLLHSALVDFRLMSEGLAPMAPVFEPEPEVEIEVPVEAEPTSEGDGA